MSEQDPMDINERRKYIHKMWGRYREAGRVEKGKLLDEMGQVTGMHRKTLCSGKVVMSYSGKVKMAYSKDKADEVDHSNDARRTKQKNHHRASPR